MTINKLKSGIMFTKLKDNNNMKKTYAPKHNPSQNPNIQGYPIVEEYKFLGITFSPNFNLNSHLQKLKKKVNFITYKILTIPRECISPYHLTILWTLLSKSILFYGIGVLPFLTRRK